MTQPTPSTPDRSPGDRPRCTRSGGGHEVPDLSDEDLSRPAGPADVLEIRDDGTVVIATDDGLVERWHHQPERLRRIVDQARCERGDVEYDPVVEVLYIHCDAYSLGTEPGPTCPIHDMPRPLPAPWESPADPPGRLSIGPGVPASRLTPRHREFEVPWSASGGTEALIRSLARHIADLETISEGHGRQVLVVSIVDEGNRFTQALVESERGVLIEAASNEFLAPGHRIGQAEMAVLDDLGFEPPDVDDGWPNHAIAVQPPVDHVEAATLLVVPLASVYRVRPSDRIQVKSFPA